MKLTEILDNIILESGQYLVDSLIKEELNIEKFKVMVMTTLDFITKYRPVRRSQFIYADKVIHEFPVDTAPVTVERVTPDSVDDHPESRIINLPQFQKPYPKWNFRYQAPTLILPAPGVFSVVGYWKYRIIPIPGSNDYDVPDLGYDDHLALNLLRAKFLSTIGRSRRAFTMQEIPITTDASELISEGQALWEQYVNDLYTTSKWHITI